VISSRGANGVTPKPEGNIFPTPLMDADVRDPAQTLIMGNGNGGTNSQINSSSYLGGTGNYGQNKITEGKAATTQIGVNLGSKPN
jgi:hypothetical protein